MLKFGLCFVNAVVPWASTCFYLPVKRELLWLNWTMNICITSHYSTHHFFSWVCLVLSDPLSLLRDFSFIHFSISIFSYNHMSKILSQIMKISCEKKTKANAVTKVHIINGCIKAFLTLLVHHYLFSRHTISVSIKMESYNANSSFVFSDVRVAAGILFSGFPSEFDRENRLQLAHTPRNDLLLD